MFMGERPVLIMKGGSRLNFGRYYSGPLYKVLLFFVLRPHGYLSLTNVPTEKYIDGVASF